MTDDKALVTVTGASGFIALHCVRELLREGYRVRGTLRSLTKEPAVRAALQLDGEADARLSFVAANLMEDDGWAAAVEGARFALHVASPVPATPTANEDELIRPAREGTLRVLRAAEAAGVSRVVITSSVSAIVYNEKGDRGLPLDERDWSDLGGSMRAYEKSKTIAERAAWDFIEGLSGDALMELVAINPAYVLGPSLLGVDNTSNEFVRKLLHREVPGLPRLYLPIVDVRDVAKAHVAAMTVPEAAGKRFILFGEECSYGELAKRLREAGYKVTTRIFPDWLVRIFARFDETVALVVPRLGKRRNLSNQQAKTVLGWQPRSLQETVLETAQDIASRTQPDPGWVSEARATRDASTTRGGLGRLR
jgi:nucleoside-diphosphate-sugar epimerase